MKALISSQKLVKEVIEYVSRVSTQATIITGSTIPDEIANTPNIIAQPLIPAEDRKAIAERREIKDVVDDGFDICVSRLSDPIGSAVPSVVLARGGNCGNVIASIDMKNKPSAKYWLPALRELSYYVASGHTTLYIISDEFFGIGKLMAVIATYTNMHSVRGDNGPPYLTYRVKRGKLINRFLMALKKAEEMAKSGAIIPQNLRECLKKLEAFVNSGTELSKPIKPGESIKSFIKEELGKPLPPLFPLTREGSGAPTVFAPEAMMRELGQEVGGAKVVPLSRVLEDEVLIITSAPIEPLEHTFFKSRSIDIIKSAEKKYEITYIESPKMRVKPRRSPALGYRQSHLHELTQTATKAVNVIEEFIKVIVSNEVSAEEKVDVAMKVVNVITDLTDIDQRYMREKIMLIMNWVKTGREDLLSWATATKVRASELEEKLMSGDLDPIIAKVRNTLIRSQNKDVRLRAFRLSINNLRGALSIVKAVASALSGA